MFSPLCAADRRHFYRALGWIMLAWVVIHIAVVGHYKETALDQPQDTNKNEDVGLTCFNIGHWLLTYHQFIILMSSCLYLDFSLYKSERYVKLSCIGYKFPSPELKLHFFPDMNSYWMKVLLAAQTITPYLTGVQYMTAYIMYYRGIPFLEEVSFTETAPPALFYMWLVTVFVCYDGLTQLGWHITCCLLYRKRWFTYIYGPAVQGKDFGFLDSLDNYPDWVFLTYLSRGEV